MKESSSHAQWREANALEFGDSEFNRLVQLAALRATRAVHVGIVGVNGAAIRTAENPVARGMGIKTAAPHFRKQHQQP